MIAGANRQDERIAKMVLFALAFLSLAWCTLFVFFSDVCQCRSVFFGNADENFFNDFFVPRAVSRMPNPYIEDCFSEWLDYRIVRRLDQCYPALANYWVGLFPENLIGAMVCTSIGMMIYIWGLIVFFRRIIPDKVALATSVACCSAPFLFAFGVGNLVFYAAGFSLVFIAWYDSPITWRKYVAALMLALAIVLKITPAVLGMFYLCKLKNHQLRYLIVAIAAAFLFFFVPFLFCGGIASILTWFHNSSMNSIEYAGANRFGLFGFVAELSDSFAIGLGGGTRFALRLASTVIGLGVLVVGWRFGDKLWDKGCSAVLGMLFIPPTMMSYTSLYIIPFVISGMYHSNDRIRKVAAVYCLSLCALLRMPLYYGSANVCFAAAASVDLAFALSLMLINTGWDRNAV